MAKPQLECRWSGSEALPGGPAEDARRAARRVFTSVQNCDSRTLGAIRGILKSRDRRAKFFSAGLFADPAWDMLLELYAAELEQRRISISSLSIASRVPPTTALRWIGELEREGLVTKRPDPLDGRRTYVGLSSNGSGAMSAYFATVTLEPPVPKENRSCGLAL